MQVAMIYGSPRKEGNSAFLAGKMEEAFRGAGIAKYRLSDLRYSGCMGCMACRKTSERCVARDDAAAVLEAIAAAEVTVLAAPVYQEYLNGQTKCLLDRFFSYLAPDHFRRLAAGEEFPPTRLARGKTVVLLLTQGQPENMYPYLEPHLTNVLRETGFSHVEIFRACRLNGAKDCLAREDLRERVQALAVSVSRRY
jgi:multimeric flavodoxin WrbA